MALSITFFHDYAKLATWVAAHTSYTINELTYAQGVGFVVIYTAA
jgi:hypothetical protein